jgi:hypothetical protein
MAVVADTEIIVQQVGRWNPADVAYVRRFWFENWDCESFDLALLLLVQPRPPLSAGWPDVNGRFWETEIVFNRVRNLVLTVSGPWDMQTPGFSMDDIRERQWEGIGLLVSDYEGLTQDGIRFGAKSAQVRHCRPAAFAPNSPGVWREYPGVFGGSSESAGSGPALPRSGN